MSEQTLPERPWEQGTPPVGRRCWDWHPTGLNDLPRIRREFRSRITTELEGAPPGGADSVEDMVMALDELMSNGIRHGRAPVGVEVCQTDDGWLLLVSDRAADDPPRPAAARDPARGGMGLGIVAGAATSSGWFAQDDVKVVWAVIPMRAEHLRP